MPTYTYRCNKCGEEYEAFQSMSDPPLKRCKKCRGALRRTFHPVGIVLKGSGFHKTDYRSKSESRARRESDRGETKSEKTDSKESGDTSGKSEKKTEKADSKESGASKESGDSGKTDTKSSSSGSSKTDG